MLPQNIYAFISIFIKINQTHRFRFKNLTRFVFTKFYEKRAEFPLFLDDPNNTSCRYICQNLIINATLSIYTRYITKIGIFVLVSKTRLVYKFK
ncbi:hypothetical protein Hanom_Chr00s091985g01799411 [Helianthus anomalus]